MKTIFGAALLLTTGMWLCYPTTSQALHQGQTVVLAGQALAGADTMGNATVTITLSGSNCYTTTDLVPSFSKTVTASSTGAWTATIIGTDSIWCAGGSNSHPTYTVRIQSSVVDKTGVAFEYEGLSIPASNGQTTQLRAIVASQ